VEAFHTLEKRRFETVYSQTKNGAELVGNLCVENQPGRIGGLDGD
jgi:hypothetical protein